MSKHPDLCVKYNNAAKNNPCDICGGRCDPWVGPEVFVEGTWGLVCDDCAHKLAPELFAAVQLARAAEADKRACAELDVLLDQDASDEAHAAALGMTVGQMFQCQADQYVRDNYPERLKVVE